MPVALINPLTDERWLRLIHDRPSSVFHSRGWLRTLADTYDLDVGAVIVQSSDGSPVAGMPFCQLSDIRGTRIACLPFSDYCDPLVDDDASWRALIGSLLEQGKPIMLRCVHSRVPLSDGRFVVTKQAHWHGTDLRRGLDDLWAGLDAAARRAIRRAQRYDVQVEPASDPEMLRAFFEMHLDVRKHKYRLLAQPYRFFENIWHYLLQDGHGQLLMATRDRDVLGGILLLEWQDVLYYKFNASAASGLIYRPNDLLVWEAIRYGCKRNFARLDFGLSDWGQTGLLEFKGKYATEEKVITFLQCIPPVVARVACHDVQHLLPRLTELFTDPGVPDAITEQAGNLLYRLFA